MGATGGCTGSIARIIRQFMKAYSWKRAALHGLIPFGLVLVGATIVGFATRIANPEKFGEGVGQLAGVGFLVGFGVSYLAQTGRRRAAWIVGISVPAGVA